MVVMLLVEIMLRQTVQSNMLGNNGGGSKSILLYVEEIELEAEACRSMKDQRVIRK